MLRRKRMALMADINNGLKNSPFVLGSGVGAVNRFAHNAKLKQAASPVIPDLPVELPEPVQTITFAPSFAFPEQTPHPFKIKYNCYSQTGTPFVFGTENENEQLLLHTINESKQFLESIIINTPNRRLCTSEYDIVIDLVLFTEGWPYEPDVLGGAIIDATQWDDAIFPPFPTYSTIVFNLNHPVFITTGNERVMAALNGASVWSVMPVLIHETLHSLGIGYYAEPKTRGWGRLLDETKTWYVGLNGNAAGSQAIAAYRTSFGTEFSRIPIENSFGGPGSAWSHFEEGVDDNEDLEYRTFDYGSGPIDHYPLPFEIMSTLVTSLAFVFSTTTAGVLADLGYAVNMNSPLLEVY